MIPWGIRNPLKWRKEKDNTRRSPKLNKQFKHTKKLLSHVFWIRLLRIKSSLWSISFQSSLFPFLSLWRTESFVVRKVNFISLTSTFFSYEDHHPLSSTLSSITGRNRPLYFRYMNTILTYIRPKVENKVLMYFFLRKQIDIYKKSVKDK